MIAITEKEQLLASDFVDTVMIENFPPDLRICSAAGPTVEVRIQSTCRLDRLPYDHRGHHRKKLDCGPVDRCARTSLEHDLASSWVAVDYRDDRKDEAVDQLSQPHDS